MKKSKVTLIMLCIAGAISCERERSLESFGPTNDASLLEDNSSFEDDFEGYMAKRGGHLPPSNFDFDTNTKMVDVGGDQFPVVDVGEGPVVLLLHGWPDSKEMWRYQIPFLVKAGYRVIAPDMRGFGDAPRTQDVAAYGLGALANDYITILNNLNIGNVHLVTHDWGAAIGWTIARYYQDYVNSFITISIGAVGNSGFNSMEQRRKNWYLFMFAQEGKAAYELAANDWSLFRSIAFHPDEDDLISNFSGDPTLFETIFKPYQANYTSLLDGCSQPYQGTEPPVIQFPMVTVPTLGLLGKYDFAMLEPQMRFSEDYVTPGNFQYKYYGDVGHWMMLEKPKRINNVIKRFLDCHAMSKCR